MASVWTYFILTIVLQTTTAQRFNESYILPAVTVESSNGACPSDEVSERVINSIREDIEEQLRNLTRRVC